MEGNDSAKDRGRGKETRSERHVLKEQGTEIERIFTNRFVDFTKSKSLLSDLITRRSYQSPSDRLSGEYHTLGWLRVKQNTEKCIV